jgi:hypothetical protein
MALVLEHAPNDKGRVTAGIPSLDSSKRFGITEAALKRYYQNALVTEYKNNELAAVAPDGKRDTTNWDAQVGIPLTSGQIIKRLRKLNSSLWYEVSTADATKMGIYHFRDGVKSFIVGFEAQTSPEFSVRVVDEKGKFKKEIRGWRTMLQRLVRARFVTEAGVFTQFGPPTRESENWWLRMQ